LNPSAIKRLQTIKRHTALGSGYSIALEDLEIRGAGNVFGVEQSGNIHAIGYDLYTKILQDSLNERKESAQLKIGSEEAGQIKDINVTYPFPALFPESYIESESLRLTYYKKLASLTSFDELDTIRESVIDIFGKTPSEVNNLFDLITIRLYCSRLGIKRLVIHKNHCNLIFISDHAFNDPFTLISRLKQTAANLDLSYKFSPSEDLSFLFYLQQAKKIDIIKQFLYHLEGKRNL
jgi:transcription-repair coupling factor (superfamily II helicase)